MSFLNHIENQVKSGTINKKDALDMKMNYLSLSKEEKEDLDNQYLDKIKKSSKNSTSIAEDYNSDTKAQKPGFNKRSLINYMKDIELSNYELIFNSYYVFLKNKFSTEQEIEDIIKKAAKKQFRGDDSKDFYKEYISRKKNENINYGNDVELEIKNNINKIKEHTINSDASVAKQSNSSILILIFVFIILGSGFFIFKNGLLKDISTKFEKKNITKYNSVKIAGKEWMSFDYSPIKFQNGDKIFHALNRDEWIKAGENKQPAWCYYGFSSKNKNSSNSRKYYNWYAVNDKRGFAPEGWKVPSVNDWKYLLNSYDNILDELIVPQLQSKYGWDFRIVDGGSIDDDDINSSGFSAVATGRIEYAPRWTTNDLKNGYLEYCRGKGVVGNWWSSSATSNETASIFVIYHETISNVYTHSVSKRWGCPVRCIRD